MGENSAAERATLNVKEIKNYELRIKNLKFGFYCSIIFCVLAGNSFAQDNTVTQAEIEFLPLQILFQQKTTDENIERKRDALLRLRNYETAEASRVAIPALQDPSEIVRATATFSVIFLPTDEAVQKLVPLLRDKSALVRREAAYALGKVGDSQAINPLLRILQTDKIAEVRNASVVALGAIGDVSAVVELVKILQRKPEAKEEFLRRSAARSVGQIAQIIQFGKRKVITPEDFLPEKYNEIETPNRPKLAETVPAFRAAIGVLIQSLQNPREFQDVKREAAFALGTIGDEAAIFVLQANLNNQDYYLAEICREALAKIQTAANAKDVQTIQ